MRRAWLAAPLLAAAVAGSARSAVPGIPTIYVEYSPSCTFTMSVDGGTNVTAQAPPGPTLPPGQYQIQVLMANPSNGYSCGAPVFTLAGPGVSSTTTFPQESILDSHVLPTLRPSSTYVAEDETNPGATRVYFSTGATGSSTSLLSPSSASGAAGASSQKDIVGSAVLPYRGRLAVVRSALTFEGKTATVLAAGRYDVGAGIWLQRAGAKRVVVIRARRVALTIGRWTYGHGVATTGHFTVKERL